MARAFRATTHGYKADLDTYERRLLSQLCADVITMLQQRGKDLAEPDTGASTDPTAETPDAGSEADEFAHFRAELAGLGTGLDTTDTDDDAEPDGLEPPEDAVLARLLPDASTDPGQAAQFRRLAEGSLRESKIADLRTAQMALESDPVILTEDRAPVFGRALNDVRLTLAARLGVEDDADAERVHAIAGRGRASTVEQFMAELYAFTTWLQESLFSAMLDVMPEEQ